jgi:hypothetical protein
MKSRIIAVAAAGALSLALAASPASADPVVDEVTALLGSAGNNDICFSFRTFGLPSIPNPAGGEPISGGCIWIEV